MLLWQKQVLRSNMLRCARMAIENELKYVLSQGDILEANLSQTMAPQKLEQAYLGTSARIRRIDGDTSLFTYKHRLSDGSNVEIETEIDQQTFSLLLLD